MALLKSRKPRDEQPAVVAPAPTVESLRRRALHRLIGAAVLVLAGVVGFPLVFDNQPRPIPVDLPIQIVDKDKAKPLVAPVAPPKAATADAPAAASQTAAPAPAVLVAPAKVPEAEARPAAPVEKSEKPVVASVEAKPTAAAEKPTPAKPAADASKLAEAERAKAILEGKTLPDPKSAAAATSARFVVQVGAFADSDKVREVRRKVEGAGLKTYTQVVETKEGARTRIRVGPFGEKSEAQQVADKIRRLDLSPSVLSL